MKIPASLIIIKWITILVLVSQCGTFLFASYYGMVHLIAASIFGFVLFIWLLFLVLVIIKAMRSKIWQSEE